jgi:hypothetical protein
MGVSFEAMEVDESRFKAGYPFSPARSSRSVLNCRAIRHSGARESENPKIQGLRSEIPGSQAQACAPE